MERKNLGYSLKNVPVASKASYTKKLLEQTESLIRRMRWKALFFEKPELKGEDYETYGFKSTKAPPQILMYIISSVTSNLTNTVAAFRKS